MWMNFVQDAIAKIEGLTSGKSRFLQASTVQNPEGSEVACDQLSQIMDLAQLPFALNSPQMLLPNCAVLPLCRIPAAKRPPNPAPFLL